MREPSKTINSALLEFYSPKLNCVEEGLSSDTYVPIQLLCSIVTKHGTPLGSKSTTTILRDGDYHGPK